MNKDELYTHVTSALGVDNVTVGNVVDFYMGNNTPDAEVARVYLGLSPKQREERERVLVPYYLWETHVAGTAVCNFISNELAEDHPMDKRFLLRHIENLCERFNLNSHQCPGFGHDIIFSKEPLASYKTFDNSIYIPPLTGHWAIIRRGESR